MSTTELVRLAAEFRQARNAHGLTQFQLGEKLDFDERTIRNVENGGYEPSDAFMRRWLRWFHDAGGDAEAADRIMALHKRSRSATTWWPPEWGTLATNDASPTHDEDPSMHRRQLLGGVVATTAAALLPGSAPDIAGYEQISRVLRRAYERIPARLHIPRVRAELGTLEFEIQNSQGNDKQRLLRVYAELHLLAAWMARWDLVDLTTAAAHTKEAAVAARTGQDRDLLAHCFSLYALILQKKPAALSMAAEAAEQSTRLVSPRRPATASYVHLAAAGVFSMVDRERDTRAALDAAQEALTHLTPRSAWRGTGVWSPARAAPFEGYALRRIGAADRAKLRLEEILTSGALQGTADRKYRVEAETDHAEVLTILGEPEEAARWATVAYDDAVAAGYPAEIERVGTLYEELRQQYGPLPMVRELGDHLHA